MEHGEWSVERGAWSVERGEWRMKMENREWGMENWKWKIHFLKKNLMIIMQQRNLSAAIIDIHDFFQRGSEVNLI